MRNVAPLLKMLKNDFKQLGNHLAEKLLFLAYFALELAAQFVFSYRSDPDSTFLHQLQKRSRGY